MSPFFQKLSVFGVLALLSDAAPVFSDSSSISWYDCKQKGSRPVTCANLQVPRDYSDPDSNRTIELSLVKVNATKQPSKGSILFNPGGPGESGVSFINGIYAESLLLATGEHHDLIGFDPRGVDTTLPFSCYKSDTLRELTKLQTPLTPNASDTSLGATWASKEAVAQECLRNSRQVGELLGTAFVARDMMEIVNALDEDGMLRFWGSSYGTVLGMTAAAMFPDRVDKIVLDGVFNPTQYYTGRDTQQLNGSDVCFAGVFSSCVTAGSQRCALARHNISARVMEEQIIRLLDVLKWRPLPAEPDQSTSVVSYGLVKSVIASALYGTSSWPALAEALDDLLNGNSTNIVTLSRIFAEGTASNLLEVNAGIRCGDSSLRANKLDAITPLIDAMYQKSFIFGDSQAIVPLTCAGWHINAKETYRGGFENLKTRRPLLFVGSPFDPVTPLAAAQNASAGFIDSVVLQNNGYGHTTLGQPSLCAAKAIRAYFVNGTLPAEGTVCEPSVPPFSNVSLVQAYASLTGVSDEGGIG